MDYESGIRATSRLPLCAGDTRAYLERRQLFAWSRWQRLADEVRRGLGIGGSHLPGRDTFKATGREHYPRPARSSRAASCPAEPCRAPPCHAEPRHALRLKATTSQSRAQEETALTGRPFLQPVSAKPSVTAQTCTRSHAPRALTRAVPWRCPVISASAKGAARLAQVRLGCRVADILRVLCHRCRNRLSRRFATGDGTYPSWSHSWQSRQSVTRLSTDSAPEG